MTLFRQVSWLAGRHPFPPSQTLRLQGPVAFGEGLTANSCGGSFGFGLSFENDKPHRIPFWLINAISAPERGQSQTIADYLSTPKVQFVVTCDISVETEASAPTNCVAKGMICG